MSLTISKIQPTGVDVTFWTLNSIYLNAITHIATISMDGFLNADSQANGNTPVTSLTISVTFVPTNVVPNISVMSALYSKISLDPFFDGATYTNDNL